VRDGAAHSCQGMFLAFLADLHLQIFPSVLADKPMKCISPHLFPVVGHLPHARLCAPERSASGSRTTLLKSALLYSQAAWNSRARGLLRSLDTRSWCAFESHAESQGAGGLCLGASRVTRRDGGELESGRPHRVHGRPSHTRVPNHELAMG
jgi:hypothetical protein